MEYILSIDQGTTGTRAIIFDELGHEICSSYAEHKQIYPRPGWVEHDPSEIWNNTLTVVSNVFRLLNHKQIDISSIKGIGLANQGETVVAWDERTGEPYDNAIVWQCRRTSEEVRRLRSVSNLDTMVNEKTGLHLDAYFSATKIKWIIDNIECARTAILRGTLRIGTLDTYLIWKLTGGRCYVTDCTTASRTMLFNIHSLDWDGELLEIFGLTGLSLPEIRETSSVFGYTDPDAFFDLCIPIGASAVDQQAALFGEQCVSPGMVKCTYGTGCFMLMNTGDQPSLSKNGLLTTVAWRINHKTAYALEGGAYIAGGALKWLRDQLGIIRDYDEIDAICSGVHDNGGVYFVPAFSGLAAPFWDQDARGVITGITAGTSGKHIVRAAVESIAYQTKNLIDCMESDSGKSIQVLKADGGVTKSRFLMQFSADLLNVSVRVSKNQEATARGAAMLAGLSVGLWTESELAEVFVQEAETFTPAAQNACKQNQLNCWDAALKKSMQWPQPSN